ncbi:uncharacterized protein LOC122918837 [Neovison vison]|uniref:uncharacterized protein LOC122918837 n=1 Tax=Neovison vison TaxID=452646 RepID=UPI001CEFFEEA|nr:uncharacterized protein LOC122918837 [Neogale vison]
MGTCSEDPHVCGASWLLRFTSLLLDSALWYFLCNLTGPGGVSREAAGHGRLLRRPPFVWGLLAPAIHQPPPQGCPHAGCETLDHAVTVPGGILAILIIPTRFYRGDRPGSDWHGSIGSNLDWEVPTIRCRATRGLEEGVPLSTTGLRKNCVDCRRGVCNTVTQRPGARGSAMDYSGNPVTLKGTQGASVLFLAIRNPELPPEFELEKMSWGIASRSNYVVMLHVFPGRDVPEWVNLQGKFEKRVHVVNTTTLRIDNLTLEDSGRYRARQSYTGGRQYDQDFHLTVYEPVPRPQIRATLVSLTPGGCNVTVECNTTGTREDLTVSWESEGLPRELEQRPAPGPAPNPWTLAVNLPLSRPSPSLTCVVSNQADQRTASQDLGDVCGRDPTGEASAVHEGVIPWIVLPVLGVLGALL